MSVEAITCSSVDGLKLEAEIATASDPLGVFVLCHPHPQMGGTMNAPLLLALQDALVTAEWNVLRFNFRGIGDSEGSTGTGTAELDDARGALELARDRWPDLPIALGGWSFGAAVAIRVASGRDDLRKCVAIAPAVEPRPGITDGVPAARDIDLRAPLLVVCGVNDKQVSPAACRAWAEGVPTATYLEMAGANHFFWGKYDDLARAVVGFLNEG